MPSRRTPRSGSGSEPVSRGRRPAAASDPLGAAFADDDAHAARPRPTSSTRTWPRDGDDRRRGALVMRQAFAGMLWSKQYYGYNVARWLDGDPGCPPPPPERLHGAERGAGDTSTRPTSCRCPTRGSTRGSPPGTSRSTRSPSPTSIRRSPSTSCSLLCREWFQHPNGALPAYEWSFDDVNPPVHALAALPRLGDRRAAGHRVPQADLPQAAAQLHVVAEPRGPRGQRPVLGRLPRARQHRRLRPLAPAVPGRELEQSDATAWMFAYCLSMLRIATILAETRPGVRRPR